MGEPDPLRDYLRKWPDRAIFGAFADDLIGVIGIMRQGHIKASHKMNAWGMYVHPDHRGEGIAASLIDAALAHARTVSGVSTIQISVTSAAPGARRLYERAGFAIWGTEPDALRHNGEVVEQHYLSMDLGQ